MPTKKKKRAKSKSLVSKQKPGDYDARDVDDFLAREMKRIAPQLDRHFENRLEDRMDPFDTEVEIFDELAEEIAVKLNTKFPGIPNRATNMELPLVRMLATLQWDIYSHPSVETLLDQPYATREFGEQFIDEIIKRYKILRGR